MAKLVENQSYRKITAAENVPKGPALDVYLGDYRGQESLKLYALIDTGADITCARFIKIMELECQLAHPLFYETIEDADTGHHLRTYLACIRIGDKKFEPVWGIHVPDDSLFGLEDMLIGREVQKELIIHLDGPNEVFNISVE